MLRRLTATAPPKDVPGKGTRSVENHRRYCGRDKEPDRNPKYAQPDRLVVGPPDDQVRNGEGREDEAKGQHNFGELAPGLHGQPLKRDRQPSRRDETPQQSEPSERD